MYTKSATLIPNRGLLILFFMALGIQDSLYGAKFFGSSYSLEFKPESCIKLIFRFYICFKVPLCVQIKLGLIRQLNIGSQANNIPSIAQVIPIGKANIVPDAAFRTA